MRGGQQGLMAKRPGIKWSMLPYPWNRPVDTHGRAFFSSTVLRKREGLACVDCFIFSQSGDGTKGANERMRSRRSAILVPVSRPIQPVGFGGWRLEKKTWANETTRPRHHRHSPSPTSSAKRSRNATSTRQVVQFGCQQILG